MVQITVEGCRSLHRLDELPRAGGAGAVEGIVMTTRIHQVKHSRCLAIHVEYCAVGILQVKHHALVAGHLVAHVSLVHRWQGWHRHIATEIETGIGMLVVAACSAVAPIVRILLQAVYTIGGRHGGGIADETRADVGVLFCQQYLLAPVADDVTHEGGACACCGMCGPAAFLREFRQTVAQHFRYHQVCTPAAAAGTVEPFTLQVTVPPATLEHRTGTCQPRLLALAVIDIFVSITQYLVALT